MQKISLRCIVVFAISAILLIHGSPAMAEESQGEEMDGCALVQQFISEGVGMDEATSEQLQAAVSQAVSAQPSAAELIVRCTVQERPEQAAIISAAAAAVLPDQATPITMAALEIVPGQAGAIWDAVDNAVYSDRQENAREVVRRTAREEKASVSAPPARDDAPASPVK